MSTQQSWQLLAKHNLLEGQIENAAAKSKIFLHWDIVKSFWIQKENNKIGQIVTQYTNLIKADNASVFKVIKAVDNLTSQSCGFLPIQSDQQSPKN